MGKTVNDPADKGGTIGSKIPLKTLNFWLYNSIFYANLQFLFDLLFDFIL